MALNPFLYLKIRFKLYPQRKIEILLKASKSKKWSVVALFCQAKWYYSIQYRRYCIDDTKNRLIELDFYTFEYYSRVNSLTVVFPCFSWFLLSDESPSYSLDNQISKNQFQELKSCLFGFHHGQITEENHVLFLSTKTATEASYVETPSQFDTRLSRLSDELRRFKVHSMSFLRD